MLVGDVPRRGGARPRSPRISPAGPAARITCVRAQGRGVPPGPREITVPLKDKPSVSVILGQATGLRYRDPDALPLRVGTAILGQGFTGRLMGTVRDREGLTYNIGAGVSEDSIADGAWSISASFRAGAARAGHRLDAPGARHLVAGRRHGRPSSRARKQGLIGGYFVGLSTTGGLAGTILTTVQRGYDLSWLDGYPEAMQALTREQVNQAIRTHLDPSTMVLVEAGSVARGRQAGRGAAPPPR